MSGILLRPAPVEHRRQVGAAAEPGLRRHDEAGVHVDGRDVRVPRMGDERDAGGPEARILVRAGDLAAELGRELAVHRRDVDADLLEDAPAHHRHDAAAARAAGMVLAVPGLALEAAGRRGFRRRTVRAPRPRAPRRRRRYRSRRAANQAGASALRRSIVAGSACHLQTCVVMGASERQPCAARPEALGLPQAPRPGSSRPTTATLRERRPGRIGIRIRASAAACTSSGTPADSRPSRITSPGRKANSV